MNLALPAKSGTMHQPGYRAASQRDPVEAGSCPVGHAEEGRPGGSAAADRDGRALGVPWSADARMAGGTRVRSWPLLVLALPSAVAVWSGWVGIGRMTGFGLVHPLPGIWNSCHLDTAITLPIGMEAYAAYALRAFLAPAALISLAHPPVRGVVSGRSAGAGHGGSGRIPPAGPAGRGPGAMGDHFGSVLPASPGAGHGRRARPPASRRCPCTAWVGPRRGSGSACRRPPRAAVGWRYQAGFPTASRSKGRGASCTGKWQPYSPGGPCERPACADLMPTWAICVDPYISVAATTGDSASFSLIRPRLTPTICAAR